MLGAWTNSNDAESDLVDIAWVTFPFSTIALYVMLSMIGLHEVTLYMAFRMELKDE